jgi:hypothetical protein
MARFIVFAEFVSLQNTYCLDNSIGELADLPVGWYAWRELPTAPWQRVKTD